MARRPPVEPRARARMVKSARDAQVDQRVEHAIDGGSREPRDMLLDGVEDLIGGRVIVALEDRAEDLASLDGQRQT